jgi:hypothetical protein
MSDVRYGFYLRPSVAMCRAQTEIHALLRHQYGLEVAGKFMPHATIKGFFASTVSPAAMIDRLDPVLSNHRAFPVHNSGVRCPYGTYAIVLDVHHQPDGTRNESLQALHEAAYAALLPLVDPSCAFTAREGSGERFRAHLTLAMADIPSAFFDEITRFLLDAEPVGPTDFLAEVVQLFAFTSEDWAGPWWDTLRWELLHGWRLVPV